MMKNLLKTTLNHPNFRNCSRCCLTATNLMSMNCSNSKVLSMTTTACLMMNRKNSYLLRKSAAMEPNTARKNETEYS
jgi:hypothetical protein